MPCPYSYTTLFANYPTKAAYPSRAELYPYLGWGKDHAMMTDPSWENTCAIRMSVCLLRCGMSLNSPPVGARVGSKCEDGRLKSKAVIIGFKRLAEHLKAEWGAPKVITDAAQLDDAQGVAVYWKLEGGYPGHIDLFRDTIKGPGADIEYGSGMYSCQYMWLWPAK